MAVQRIGFIAPSAGNVGSPPSGDVPMGPGPGGNAMEVDLDEAPKLIAGLKTAIEKLQTAYEESTILRTAQPPGKDPYSGGAAQAIQMSASDDMGGYGWANKEAQKALLKTIENIEKSVASYGQTDSDAHDAMKPKE
jgi:hypothetical protein